MALRKYGVLSVVMLLSWLMPLKGYPLGVCHDDSVYSGVTRVDPSVRGVVAVLGGSNAELPAMIRGVEAVDSGANSMTWRTVPAEVCEDARCSAPARSSCAASIPRIDLSKDVVARVLGRSAGYIDDVEQNIGACVEYEGYYYFGIAFYAGEGVTGLGGIGRYHPDTGELEVRRPHALSRTSVTHMVHDGQQLWLATANYHECSGLTYTQGLLRYDWQSGALVHEHNHCGFFVNDLLWHKGRVWVATDLGLSWYQPDYDRDASAWPMGAANYVPDVKGQQPMKRALCDDLYRQLLETASDVSDGVGASPLDQTLELVARIRPYVFRTYVERGRAREGRDELQSRGESEAVAQDSVLVEE